MLNTNFTTLMISGAPRSQAEPLVLEFHVNIVQNPSKILAPEVCENAIHEYYNAKGIQGT